MLRSNKHFKYFDGQNHGYGILKINLTHIDANYYYNDILNKNINSTLLKTLTLKHNDNKWST